MTALGGVVACGAEYVYDINAHRWRVVCDCGARCAATFDTLDDAVASWVGHRKARAVEMGAAS